MLQLILLHEKVKILVKDMFMLAKKKDTCEFYSTGVLIEF